MAGDHRLHRGGSIIESLITGFLTPLGSDALIKIALRVNEAHADQRQSEIGSLFAMISREDSKAAGIDRQRDMQPEFRRKIGDRVPGHIGMLFAEPGALRRQGFVKGHHYAVVMAQERGVRSRRLQLCLGDLLQEFYGIVMCQFPEGLIQMLKKPASVGLPTPPQVISQFGQTPYTGGRHSINRLSAHFPDSSREQDYKYSQKDTLMWDNRRNRPQNITGPLTSSQHCT